MVLWNTRKIFSTFGNGCWQCLPLEAELLQEGIFFLIHLLARDVLVKKKEIEKTKPTFIISVLKVEYLVVLVSSISNFVTNKTSLANNWMSFSSSNLALKILKNPSIMYRFRMIRFLKNLAFPELDTHHSLFWEQTLEGRHIQYAWFSKGFELLPHYYISHTFSIFLCYISDCRKAREDLWGAK